MPPASVPALHDLFTRERMQITQTYSDTALLIVRPATSLGCADVRE